jgi:hypothetical protein
MTLVETVSISTAFLGVIASFYGFFNWLRHTERKRLESERQLVHALNNFALVRTAIEQLQEELQEQTIELAQIKTYLSYTLPFADKPRGLK